MIYKNYEEFSRREKQKQRQNGCTQKFLDKYFNGDLDKFIVSNRKNERCFNCYQCYGCYGCRDCRDCRGCRDCYDCRGYRDYLRGRVY